MRDETRGALAYALWLRLERSLQTWIRKATQIPDHKSGRSGAVPDVSGWGAGANAEQATWVTAFVEMMSCLGARTIAHASFFFLFLGSHSGMQWPSSISRWVRPRMLSDTSTRRVEPRL